MINRENEIMNTGKVILICLTLITLVVSGPAFAADMTVYKDPNCGCCGKWVKHIEAAGHNVITKDMNNTKTALGVPNQLRSCHTAKVDGYVLEGHVPIADVERLLFERPEAQGLAVPGMPTGSPGMEMPGVSPDSYEVILFDDKKNQVFAHY
jgi:hypothetical protein